MIFTEEHAQMVLDGRKRQTRRPVKPGEYAVYNERGEITEVRDANGRLKRKVGKDYAAQTGRGKKAIGRTPPIEAIKQERLGRISRSDISAEGVRDQPKSAYCLYDARSVFRGIWNSLYRHRYRWEDDPEVWALTFKEAE